MQSTSAREIKMLSKRFQLKRSVVRQVLSESPLRAWNAERRAEMWNILLRDRLASSPPEDGKGQDL